MTTIHISIGSDTYNATIHDTPTGRAIIDALPFEGSLSTWGGEFYIDVPVDQPLEEDASAIVEKGDLAYWPSGPVFCVFFGKTPASTDDRPAGISPVNVFGKIDANPETLYQYQPGTVMKVHD